MKMVTQNKSNQTPLQQHTKVTLQVALLLLLLLLHVNKN